MNERLKQLALQAGFHTRPSTEGIQDGIDWSHGSYGYDKVLEKFAELIVRECITIAYEHNNSGEGGVVAEQIKQHFGVEL